MTSSSVDAGVVGIFRSDGFYLQSFAIITAVWFSFVGRMENLVFAMNIAVDVNGTLMVKF